MVMPQEDGTKASFKADIAISVTPDPEVPMICVWSENAGGFIMVPEPIPTPEPTPRELSFLTDYKLERQDAIQQGNLDMYSIASKHDSIQDFVAKELRKNKSEKLYAAKRSRARRNRRARRKQNRKRDRNSPVGNHRACRNNCAVM